MMKLTYTDDKSSIGHHSELESMKNMYHAEELIYH